MKTSQLIRNGILILMLASAVQLPALAQSDTSFNRDKMDRYFDKLEDEQKVMASVAIDSAGKEVYNRSIGFIDQKNGKPIPADSETEYRIGSVSKMFTATIIMQLVEEGKLSLDTPLAEFYPDIPKASDITIENMLRHRSGLFNFTNAPDYPKWMTEEQSKKQILERIRGYDSQFAPGTQTSYSNTNYVLLSYIIEEITGEPYADQLRKRITGPLNLQHTSYGDDINTGQNEAASFRYVQSQWKKQPETDMSIPTGAGALVSTPGDMTDFIRALFKGELVSQQSLDKMTTLKGGLGIGMMRFPFADTYAYGHNGGIDGFQSNLLYFPDQDVASAFTGNGLNYSMNNVSIGMSSIYFGKDFEIPSFDTPTITLSSEQMQRYVGTYSSGQLPMNIEVFIRGGTLMAQATGQSAFPLTATNETTMRFEQAGLVMEFDSLKNDQYQQFTLKQGGGSYLFTRQN